MVDVRVGDLCQIRDGAIDVTNGLRAELRKNYGDGGPLWCKVERIDQKWITNGIFGLPDRVVKVQCVNENGIVVWQVKPDDCVNIIRKPENGEISFEDVVDKQNQGVIEGEFVYEQNALASVNAFAPKRGSNTWSMGSKSRNDTTGKLSQGVGISTKYVNDSAIGDGEVVLYPEFDDESNIQTSSGSIPRDKILKSYSRSAWQNDNKRKEMLNDDQSMIRNQLSYPAKIKEASGMFAAQYDYQIVPSDPRYPTMISLEDKLKEMRASLGLPVHGNNQIARAMKYYMYNRYKTPDQNLAHNKSVTYVFFTRPDLNILNKETLKANAQSMGHSESTMIWRRYPDIFKLLTDSSRCQDSNNFNLLLSNQCRSFDITDETLNVNEAGKSWNEYVMQYGDSYTGRTAGEFTCEMEETSDYSVINMIKLWITYIDNVARGAWSPSYNLNGSGVDHSFEGNSHVFTKTLDYAASAYVFKCGPDGEDVLYWSKYYGVFPISTGASALTWNAETPPGNTPRLPIRFKYAFKRDMSPISLLEFNHNAGVDGESISAESSFNVNYGHSSRPYVGAPYIEIKLGRPELRANGSKFDQNRTEIRLKFRKASDSKLTDDLLYRTSLAYRPKKDQFQNITSHGGDGTTIQSPNGTEVFPKR